MALLRIAQLGHPVLRSVSEPVPLRDITHSAIQGLVDDMIDTMRDAEGVGIAAPQVYRGIRIIAIEVRDSTRYERAEAFPLQVLVNPTLVLRDPKTQMGSEGCLSVTGLRGTVPRHTAVGLKGWDRKGVPIKLELHGFPAVIAQHEMDHINGYVYLDRMSDLRNLGFEREYRRHLVEHTENPVVGSAHEASADDHD